MMNADGRPTGNPGTGPGGGAGTGPTPTHPKIPPNPAPTNPPPSPPRKSVPAGLTRMSAGGPRPDTTRPVPTPRPSPRPNRGLTDLNQVLPARRDHHIEAVSDFLSVARTGGLGPNLPGRRMPTSAPSGGPGIEPPACSSEGRRASGQGSTPSPEGQAVRPASLPIAPGRTAEAPEASQASGAGAELPDVLIGVADYAAGGR